MDANLTEADLLNVSTRCKSFVELNPEVVRLILDRCREKRFSRGAALMRQGDPGDSLMLLLEGSAHVSSHGLGDVESSIARLSEFDIFGEMAVLTGQDRTVDVTADTDVRALILDVEEFQRLASEHPELGMVLTRLMADRLGSGSIDAFGGKRVDRYRILDCVGRGSMAVVYKAAEGERETPVALKMMSHRLLYEPGAMARFRREASLLEVLAHPSIARIERQFTAFRTSFIAMEFCDGPDLSSLLAQWGGLPELEVRKAIGQVAGALDYMHGKGIVHRDLKPSNVMSTRGGRIKLTDFGLAKPADQPGQLQVTHSVSSLMGTPLYMAPEQLSGEPATPASDVYALGCLTYELLTGKPLFRGRGLFDLVQNKLSFVLPEPASIGPGVSQELYEFLSNCLVHDRLARRVDLQQVSHWAGDIDTRLVN